MGNESSGVPFLDRRREEGPSATIPSALERHIQTVLVGLVCAVLAWLGNKVMSTSEIMMESRAETRVHIETLKGEIKSLNRALDSSYSVAEAVRELAYRDKAIGQLERRIRDLEQRITRLTQPPWVRPVGREGDDSMDNGN